MKKIKTLLVLCLVSVLVAGMFCGCENTQAKMEALSGTWTLTAADSEEQATILLEAIDLYEEEIALVDLGSLNYVQIVEFDMDGNYRFAYDVEGIKACVHEFYTGVFDALYEGRTSLNEVYGVEFDDMSQDEFRAGFADMYGAANYDTMIDQFTEYAYDYTALAEDLETGTYTIVGDSIMCTIAGETQAEALGYAIDGDSLTLTYADAEEVYTKAN